jgi:hypothetical protein
MTAVDLGEQRARVKGIDDEVVLGSRRLCRSPDEEVAREVDPFQSADRTLR